MSFDVFGNHCKSVSSPSDSTVIPLWSSTGVQHRRDIRKALAALARELNASEAKRLEIEGALRAAGGGLGIRHVRRRFALRMTSCVEIGGVRTRAPVEVYRYAMQFSFVLFFLYQQIPL